MGSSDGFASCQRQFCPPQTIQAIKTILGVNKGARIPLDNVHHKDKLNHCTSGYQYFV